MNTIKNIIEAFYNNIAKLHEDLIVEDPTVITPILVWLFGLPIIILYEFFIRED